MTANAPTPPQSSPRRAIRLDSWKAIANHLGRDVRTVIRWEKERQLPVRRIPGGQARSVFAFSDELDAWLSGEHAADQAPPAVTSNQRSRWIRIRHSRALLIALVFVLVLAAAGWRFVAVSASLMSRVSATDDVVEAFDSSGRTLWTYKLPGRALLPLTASNATIEDIDDDGRPEAVVGLVMGAADGTQFGRLTVFDSRGRVRWERALDDRLTFGETDYGPPWLPVRVLVHRLPDGRPRIAVSAHHLTWWPDIVAAFDGNGAPVGRFVNAGWIYDLQSTAGGRRLLAAGVTNAHGGSIMAVLDSANIDGVSPPATARFTCRNCPAGAPLRYVFVPWSDIARPAESLHTAATVFPSGQVELRCPQVLGLSSPTIPEAIIDFSPALEVASRTVSDAFWPRHAELERGGQLAHSAAACPWREGPPVYVWTAERGWNPQPPASTSLR